MKVGMPVFDDDQREFLESKTGALFAELFQQTSVTKKKDGHHYWKVTVQMPRAKPISMRLERHHPGEPKGWSLETLSGTHPEFMTRLSRRVRKKYPTVERATDDFKVAVVSVAVKMLAKRDV